MNKSRGRRPGSPDTRGRILEVARELFREQGYAATTMRAVAEGADVDAALVSYFFGSKHGLLSEALTLTISPSDVLRPVLEAGRQDLGARLVDAVTSAWNAPEAVEPLRSLIVSIIEESDRVPTFDEFMEREIVAPLGHALGSDQAARDQAAVIVMLLAGVVITRTLMELGPAVAVDAATVERLVGQAIDAVVGERRR